MAAEAPALSAPPRTRQPWWRSRRVRRFSRWLWLLAALLGLPAAVAVVIVLAVVGPGFDRPGPFAMLMISISVIFGGQWLLATLLGLAACVGGALALAGDGSLLKQRLVIRRRRLQLGLWSVVLVRMLCFLLLTGALLWVYTPLFPIYVNGGPFFYWLMIILRRAPLLAVPVAVVGIIQWFFGPLLKVRYNLALGALLATWAVGRAGRASLALTGRLALSLLGLIGLVWSFTAASLAYLMISDPIYTASGNQFIPFDPNGSLTPYAAVAFVLLIISAGFLLSQVLLPFLFTFLYNQRLKVRL